MITKEKIIRKNILVIDPDEEFSRNVRLYLEENYDVNTRQGIEYLDFTISLKKVDLLIIEADSVDKNMLKLLKQIKQNHPKIKIIIMYTYFSSDRSLEQTVTRNADDLIAKPFDVTLLKNKVDRLLSPATPQRSFQ